MLTASRGECNRPARQAVEQCIGCQVETRVPVNTHFLDFVSEQTAWAAEVLPSYLERDDPEGFFQVIQDAINDAVQQEISAYMRIHGDKKLMIELYMQLDEMVELPLELVLPFNSDVPVEHFCIHEFAICCLYSIIMQRVSGLIPGFEDEDEDDESPSARRGGRGHYSH